MIRPSGFAHDYETVKEIRSSRLAFLIFVYEKLMDVLSVISFYGRFSCNFLMGESWSPCDA